MRVNRTKESINFHKASESGLEIVDDARTRIGLKKLDQYWIRKANTTRKTLDDFWKQLEIPEEDFIAICQAVEIDWKKVVIRGHFSTLRTKITDAVILTNSLRELGINVKTYAEVRGSLGQKVCADVVAVLEGEYDLGFSENSDGTFDLIADLWGVAKKHNQTKLINSIYQRYAINKTLSEVKQRGLSQFYKQRKCPRCDSSQNSKHGYFQGKQNYKCHNCGTQFTITESKL